MIHPLTTATADGGDPIMFDHPFDGTLMVRLRPWLAYSGNLLQTASFTGPYYNPAGLSERSAWGYILASMAVHLNTDGPGDHVAVGDYVLSLAQSVGSPLHHVAVRFLLLHAVRNAADSEDLAQRVMALPEFAVEHYHDHINRQRKIVHDYHIHYPEWVEEEVAQLLELIKDTELPPSGLLDALPDLPDLQGGY